MPRRLHAFFFVIVLAGFLAVVGAIQTLFVQCVLVDDANRLEAMAYAAVSQGPNRVTACDPKESRAWLLDAVRSTDLTLDEDTLVIEANCREGLGTIAFHGYVSRPILFGAFRVGRAVDLDRPLGIEDADDPMGAPPIDVEY